MGNSGIYWVDLVFNYCVKLLYDAASFVGISYEEINVWLFVIILPIFLLMSGILILVFFIKLQNLKSSI